MGLLPTTKKKIKKDINNQIITIYGNIKIGKSSFAAEMDSPLFISTEPGLNALEVFEAPCENWETFLEICAELAKDFNGFKNIVVDTINNLYQQCEVYILKKNNAQHPTDIPGFAKGYSLINSEFSRVIKKLSMMPIGLVFISHAKEKEVDTKAGKVQKTTLSMSAGGAKIITGLSDMVLFFDTQVLKEGNAIIEKRVIRTRPSYAYDSGSRWPIADEIPLSYQEFKKEYNNNKK